jgi:1,4-alpha-glucan branching enzyme
MWAHPGKKLLFMGGEFGQRREWQHDESLEWHVLDSSPAHVGVQSWVRDLNALLRKAPALHERDFAGDGFEWIDCNDRDASVLTFLRRGNDPSEVMLVVCNCTPVPRANYTIGLPEGGWWLESLNSDAREYGGSGAGNFGAIEAAPLMAHGRPFSVTLQLPPLSVLFLQPDRRRR